MGKRFLIITQKVDRKDPILGFFHRWILEFSKNTDKLTVICLQEGDYDLPGVRVLSLGKEDGVSKITYVKRLYSFVWRESGNYDSVFVHMNPEYVVLCGLLWRIFGKKIGLWYLHKSVDLKLRVASLFAHIIFSASEKSFRLKTKKLKIVGHGIDTEQFYKKEKNPSAKLKLLHVGRISVIKRVHTMLEALHHLNEKGVDSELVLVGAKITDQKYQRKIDSYIKEHNLENKVKFYWDVPHKDVVTHYQNADIFLNFSDTGSVDKSVLEAMATGTKVLTSNEAFRDILPKENLTSNEVTEIAQKIQNLRSVLINKDLSDYVRKEHGLESLIKKIINFF